VQEAEEPGLALAYGLFGEADLGGDFGGAKAFEDDEAEDGLVGGGQGFEVLLDGEAPLGGEFGGGGEVFDGVAGGGVVFALEAKGFGELVAGDAEHEGFEGLGVAEFPCAEGEESGDEGILGEFFGEGGVGEASAEEGLESGEEAFGELVFEFWVAVGDSGSEGEGAEPGQGYCKREATTKGKRPDWGIRPFRDVELGDVLLSHTPARAVPSGLRGLTSVFGMGTGGTLSLGSPKAGELWFVNRLSVIEY
jgi:hypothetical protein